MLKLLDVEVQSLPTTLQGKVFSTYEEHFRLPSRYSADELADQLSQAAKSVGAFLQLPPVTLQEKNGETSHGLLFFL